MTDKVRVGAVDDFESGAAHKVQVGTDDVALVRIDDTFYALGDRCSHANYSLSEGEVDCGQHTLECWKHGAQFALASGKPETLPATQPVPVYEVEVANGEVFVSLPGGAS